MNHHTKTKNWLNVMVHAGVIHDLSLTSNTTIATVPMKEGKPKKWLISKDKIDFKQLGFISKTKKAVTKKDIEEKPILKPYYINFFTKQEGEFLDIVEIDINKAYWTIALQKGYIDRELYDEGLEVEKMTRLIAWGAVATVKVNYTFDGKQYHYIDETVNKRTRSYFFDVAHELGLMMADCLREMPGHCYFFWVDAFFVSKEAAKHIEKYFDNKGLGVKYNQINKMTSKKHPDGWQVEVEEIKKDGTIKKKPFFFPTKDSRKELINRTRKLLRTGKQQKSTI